YCCSLMVRLPSFAATLWAISGSPTVSGSLVNPSRRAFCPAAVDLGFNMALNGAASFGLWLGTTSTAPAASVRAMQCLRESYLTHPVATLREEVAVGKPVVWSEDFATLSAAERDMNCYPVLEGSISASD